MSRLREIEQQRAELYDETGAPVFEHYLSVIDFDWLITENYRLREWAHDEQRKRRRCGVLLAQERTELAQEGAENYRLRERITLLESTP